MSGPHSTLVVRAGGPIGIISGPHRRYEPVGAAPGGKIVGAGRNGEGFWVAARGFHIVEIQRVPAWHMRALSHLTALRKFDRSERKRPQGRQ